MNVVRWISWERQKSHVSQRNQQFPGMMLSRTIVTSNKTCNRVFKSTGIWPLRIRLRTLKEGMDPSQARSLLHVFRKHCPWRKHLYCELSASKLHQGQQEEMQGRSLEGALPSVWHVGAQGSFLKNKGVHLFLVLWLQKPAHHLPQLDPVDLGTACHPGIWTTHWWLAVRSIPITKLCIQVMWAQSSFSAPLRSAAVCAQDLQASLWP